MDYYAAKVLNFPAALLYVDARVRYHYHISIQCIPKTFTRSP